MTDGHEPRSSRVSVDRGRGVQVTHGDHARPKQVNIWTFLHIGSPWVTAGVVAVLLAAGAIVLIIKPWAGTPNLSLVDYHVAAPITVDGTEYQLTSRGNEPLTRTDERPTSVNITPIDITLKNSGATPGVVVEAIVTVVFAESLGRCVGIGGGIEASANYTVVLPVDELVGPPPTVPYTVTSKVLFEVAPNKDERFTITIGPDVQSVSDDAVHVFAADVALKLDYQSEPMRVGRYAWLTMAGGGTELLDYANRDLAAIKPTSDPSELQVANMFLGCERDNRARLLEVNNLAAVRSAELNKIIKGWTAMPIPKTAPAN